METVFIEDIANQEDIPYTQLLSYAMKNNLIARFSSEKVRGEDIPVLLQGFHLSNPQIMDAKKKRLEEKEKKRGLRENMIISSGFSLEGFRILEYVDFISSETVLGMGFFKSIGASLDNMLGSESALNTKIQEARDISKNRLKEKAADLGCNAIIGMDIELTMFSDTMIGVVCNGTAVKIEPL